MEKNKTLKIVGLIIGLLVIVGVAVYFIGNKKEENKDSTNTSEKSDNTSQKTNVKSDFWLGNASIPSKTKELPSYLVDGIDVVPIDLKKLDSTYTFNYSEYNNNNRTDIKVGSISEVKGNGWHGTSKEIDVKNSNDESVFKLVIHSNCNDNHYATYEEAINSNCWLISLDEDRLFNKKFDYQTVDGVIEIMENIFDLFGKPTHIYVRDDDELVVKDDGIGSLSSIIVYDYGSFKLKAYLLDTYNKKYDYRMLDFNGLVYLNPGVSEGIDSLATKDIINELVK